MPRREPRAVDGGLPSAFAGGRSGVCGSAGTRLRAGSEARATGWVRGLGRWGHRRSQGAGVAVGRFTDCPPSGRLTVVDVLRDHLDRLAVPILGGLPLGHGHAALPVPLGMPTLLDGASRRLVVDRGMAAASP